MNLRSLRLCALARNQLSGKLPDMNDPYLDFVRQHWAAIADVYNQFAAHHPVMLVDVQEGEIHAFPFADFAMQLAPASRTTVAEQYARAVETRCMVLFVRDTERKVFQSYTLQLEDESPASANP